MLDPGSSLLKPKNKHPTPKQARPTTPIRVHLRHLSACICVNRLTRDPLGWQNPFATETGGLFQTGNSVASAEQTSAAHETNPTKLHTVSSRAATRDPVFSGSFEVRAGFGIGGIFTAFIAGLNSKRPASMEFIEPGLASYIATRRLGSNGLHAEEIEPVIMPQAK